MNDCRAYDIQASTTEQDIFLQGDDFVPTTIPTPLPSVVPTGQPSSLPSSQPSRQPTGQPTRQPSTLPTLQPARRPTGQPTRVPSSQPTCVPSNIPSGQPTLQPTLRPTRSAEGIIGDFTTYPTGQPSRQPTTEPTGQPTGKPSYMVCLAGYWGDGLGPCSACPVGRYKEFLGGRIDSKGSLSDCLYCPTGKTTSRATGAINYGSVLLKASSSASACNVCIPGYYYSSSGSCLQCPVGTFKSSTGNAAPCRACPPGKSPASGFAAKGNIACVNDIPSFAYSPSDIVKAGSGLPHLTYAKFFEDTKTRAAFNISGDSPLLRPSLDKFSSYVPYVWKVSPFPLMLLLGGWASVAMYQLFMSLRYLLPCVNCFFSSDDVEEIPHRVIKVRRRIQGCFVFILAFALMSIHLVWFGYVDLEQAFQGLTPTLDSLNRNLLLLSSSSDQIKSAFTAISAKASISGQQCYSAASVAALVAQSPSVTAATSFVLTGAGSISPYVTLVRENVIENYVKMYRPYLIFAFYAYTVTLALGFGISLILQNKRVMFVFIGFSELAVLALSLVATVEVYLVMGTSDFCMNPIKFLNGPIIGSRTVKEIMAYYTGCATESKSPFQSSVDSLDTILTSLIDALVLDQNSASSASCTTELSWARAQLVAALASNRDIETLTAGCAPTYSLLRNLVLEGVCGAGVSGFYTSFMAHILSSACLFAVMVLASMLFPYFGPAWSMTNKSVHAADALEREMIETGKLVVVEIVPTFSGRTFGRSTRIGVNPTLTQLDHDPFRDPLDEAHWRRMGHSDLGESKDQTFY